jgi:hypothetical protein
LRRGLLRIKLLEKSRGRAVLSTGRAESLGYC